MENGWIDKWWKPEWAELEGLSAMYDLEHGWLILDVSAAERLPTDLWQRMKSAFRFSWWGGHQWMVAKWSPTTEDLFETYFGLEVEIIKLHDDENDRAAKYGEFAEHAVKRSEVAFQASEDAVGGIPLGQPILVGHHSEKRHRATIARAQRAMDRSVAERKKAAYWQARQEGAERWLAMKMAPGVIKRRIERLEADLRRQQRDLKKAQAAGAPNSEMFAKRSIAHLEQRIEYERARYIACGGDKLDEEAAAKRQEWAPGTIVRNKYGDTLQVVRLNKKTATLATFPFSRTTWFDQKVREERWGQYEKVAGPDDTEVVGPDGLTYTLAYRTRKIVPGDYVFIDGTWRKVVKATKKTVTYITTGGGAFRQRERKAQMARVTGLMSGEEFNA